jgi:hypothetical protein
MLIKLRFTGADRQSNEPGADDLCDIGSVAAGLGANRSAGDDLVLDHVAEQLGILKVRNIVNKLCE